VAGAGKAEQLRRKQMEQHLPRMLGHQQMQKQQKPKAL
jgi:hypothetical protein